MNMFLSVNPLQCLFMVPAYRKSSIKPRGGGLFNFGHSKGSLLERGAYSKKLDEKDIYGSFISLLPHILRIQHTTLRVKYINSTNLYPKLYQN